jgi:valine--pyruvate aminotransferase
MPTSGGSHWYGARVPGSFFFPGLAEEWRHKHECIRINYSADARTVEKGLHIIAEEVKAAC